MSQGEVRFLFNFWAPDVQNQLQASYVPAPPPPPPAAALKRTDCYVCLYSNGAEVFEQVKVHLKDGHVLGTPGTPGPGTYTTRAYSALIGGTLLFESAPFTVPAGTVATPVNPAVPSGTLSGVPSSATAGSALVGTGAGGAITFTATNVSTPYAALVTTAAVLGQAATGQVVGSAVALSGTSGTAPALTPSSAGTVRLALLNGPAGTILALSGSITVAAAPGVQSGSFSGVPSSATAGAALSGTITFTATNISTPYAALVANAATVGQAVGANLVGSAVALSGMSGAVPALTPPAAGTVRLALLNAAAGTIIALSGPITVGAASSTQGNANVTLTGMPASIVAGQPLSGVTFAFPAGGYGSAQLVLYNVTAGAEEGPRIYSLSLPTTNLELYTPQTNALYTVRAFNYEGTTLLFESAQIAVSAAPGALPTQPAQTADTNRTAFTVTVNWASTGTSFRVLAKNGIGGTFGTLASATVTTNSYAYTDLPANSNPRTLVVPQNANGYGTVSGSMFSIPSF